MSNYFCLSLIMLKNSPKTPYLIIVILVGVFAFLYFSKPSGHKQEVERLRKRQESLTDSALQVIEYIRDSSKVAIQEIEKAYIERLKTTEERILKEKVHEKVIYIRYPNDSLRWIAITELYPSLKEKAPKDY